MKKLTKQFNTHFNFAILAIVTVGFLLWHTIAIFNLEQDLTNLQTNITIPTKNDIQDIAQGTNTDSSILYNEDGSIDTSNWKVFENKNFIVKYPAYFTIKKIDSTEGFMKDSFLFLKPIDNFNSGGKSIDIILGGPFEKITEKKDSFDNWYGWASRPGDGIGKEQKYSDIILKGSKAFYKVNQGFGYQNEWNDKHVKMTIVFPNKSKKYSAEISGLVKEKDFDTFYKYILFAIAETFEFKI